MMRTPLALALLPLVSCGPGTHDAPTTWDAEVEKRILSDIAAHPENTWAGTYVSVTLAFACSDRLVLGPRGDFTFHSACCVQTNKRDGGRWYTEGERLHVDFERDDLEDRSFLFLPWDRGRFLVPEDKLGTFTNMLERVRVGGGTADGIFACFDVRDVLERPLEGWPRLPAPWDRRAAFGIVRARLLSAEEDPARGTEHSRYYEVVLEGDENTGLWPGQSLKSERTGEWATIESCGEGTSRARVMISRTSDATSRDLVDRLYTNAPR